MKNNSKNLGLVTKKFNEFFLVDLKNQKNYLNREKFLCKVRKSVNFKNQLIYVGDSVVNALSENLKVEIFRDGKKYYIEFETVLQKLL